MDWELPKLDDPQVSGPEPDQPAPWSRPNQPQQREPAQQRQPEQREAQLPPVAPPPTWALTEPTPPAMPEAPQYMPPAPAPRQQLPARRPQYPPLVPQSQQPAWPPRNSPDPLRGLAAAPNQQPASYQAQVYQPAQSQYSAQPVQSVPPADAWFLPSEPIAAAQDEDVQPATPTSSLLTAGLTVGFALLVIVLVLVFIQLMTSLLK
jgi:hypothetical protein